EEGRWAAIVAGGNAPPVFETAKHDLDAAAAPVAALVVSDRLVARSPARDAGLDALGMEGRCRAGVVADLSGRHEETQGAAVRIGDGMELGVHAAFGRVDHDRLRLSADRSQTLHHPREHARLAPTLPAVVERLVGPVGAGCIAPAQAVAVDEHDAAQHPPVINPRLAVALGKERP
nr:hypothetical protein [Tanacetum cinerariifolium]